VEQAEQALADARAQVETAERDRDWLDHAIGELERLGAEPGEEEALAIERAQMQAGARIAEDLQTVADHLGGADGGLSQLRQAARGWTGSRRRTPLLEKRWRRSDRAVIEGDLGEQKLEAAPRR
jgi:DNA repair protein RecN (Recombination protein N)